MGRPPTCHCHCKTNNTIGLVMRVDHRTQALMWFRRVYGPYTPKLLPLSSQVAFAHIHEHDGVVLGTVSALSMEIGQQTWSHSVEPLVDRRSKSFDVTDRDETIVVSNRRNAISPSGNELVVGVYDSNAEVIRQMSYSRSLSHIMSVKWIPDSRQFFTFEEGYYSPDKIYAIGNVDDGTISAITGLPIAFCYDIRDTKAIVLARPSLFLSDYLAVLDFSGASPTLTHISNVTTPPVDLAWLSDTDYAYSVGLTVRIADAQGNTIKSRTFGRASPTQGIGGLRLAVVDDEILVSGRAVTIAESGDPTDGVFDLAKLDFNLNIKWHRQLYAQDAPNVVISEIVKGSASENEVQLIGVDRPLLGGYYGVLGNYMSLEFRGEETAYIQHDFTAAQIEGRLSSLVTIGSGNVSVRGGPFGLQPLTVEFKGLLANQDVDMLSANTDSLYGSASRVFNTVTGICADDQYAYVTAMNGSV